MGPALSRGDRGILPSGLLLTVNKAAFRGGKGRCCQGWPLTDPGRQPSQNRPRPGREQQRRYSSLYYAQSTVVKENHYQGVACDADLDGLLGSARCTRRLRNCGNARCRDFRRPCLARCRHSASLGRYGAHAKFDSTLKFLFADAVDNSSIQFDYCRCIACVCAYCCVGLEAWAMCSLPGPKSLH